MLKRLDTLLVRLIALMAIAVSGAIVCSFLLIRMQENAQDGPPKSSVSVAVEALHFLEAHGWPVTLSEPELRDLRLLEYSRTPEPIAADLDTPLSDMVREQLGLGDNRQVAVTLDADNPNPAPPMSQPGPTDWPPHGPGRGGRFDPGRPGISSVVSVEVGTGDWVNVTTTRIALNRPPRAWGVLILLVFLIATAFWAARNAISPLTQMAKAADVLAADYKHHPVEERGPSDVRRALHAFNQMGRQLESTVANQRQVLVAIGHDLRTPITSLRLKTEMLSDPEERSRLMRAIGELEHLTEAALIAASASHSKEEFRPLDLYSIVDSIADDLGSLGYDVAFKDTEDRPVVAGRAGDLSRAVRNIVENAVQYGARARIRLVSDGTRARILVEDNGPGIPEQDMEVVFQPLVRLEQSRNRETGGHGLGLHISRTLIEAHHGEIRLTNLAGGGLQVEISLPRLSA